MREIISNLGKFLLCGMLMYCHYNNVIPQQYCDNKEE